MKWIGVDIQQFSAHWQEGSSWNGHQTPSGDNFVHSLFNRPTLSVYVLLLDRLTLCVYLRFLANFSI